MFYKIVSKVLVDVGILGGCREEIFLLVFAVGWFVGSDVGEDVKTDDGGRRDGGAGDDVCGTVRDVEEGEFFNVVESGPDRSGRWGVLELGRLGVDGLEDAGGDVEGAWVIPSVVRTLKDLEDGGGGVRNVLLIDVIKGGPGSDRDVGKGGGGNDGGLRGSKRHLRQLAPLKRLF